MFYHLHFFHIIAILLKLQLKVSLTGLKLTLAVFMLYSLAPEDTIYFKVLSNQLLKYFAN